MTKIYPLIHLNDFSHIVDKEGRPEGSIVLYDHKAELILKNTKNAVILGYSIENTLHKLYPVLGSNDPSLNLPLLPKVKEDEEERIELLSIDKYPKGGPYDRLMRIGFQAGYKAASSKKYTEEDIDKALAMKNMGYGKTHILKTLNPKPTAVEVEMEELDAFDEEPEGGRWVMVDHAEGFTSWERPKVDVNNIIVVKRWIYDVV